MVKSPPDFVKAMDCLAHVATQTATERAVLLAAIRWANSDGLVFASIQKWARLAGLHERTLQRNLRKLVRRGIVLIETQSIGGRPRRGDPKTTRYVIPALRRNPGMSPGNEPRHTVPETPASSPANPGNGSAKPRPTATRSTREQPEEQQRTSADVVDSLAAGLLKHPNATSERLDWVRREAPSKRNPAGWAAEAIRKGYDIPSSSPEEQRRARAEVINDLARDRDSLPPAERAELEREARRRRPDLTDKALSAVMVGLLAERRGITIPPKDSA